MKEATRWSMLSRMLSIGLAIGSMLGSSELVAQPPGSPERRAAAATFLDRTQPKSVRLQAAVKMGYNEDDVYPRLLAIGADRTEDDAIRLAALERHPLQGSYLETVLRILDDPQDGGEALDAGLIGELNKRLTFRLTTADEQRVRSVMRSLLDDTRPAVRLASYRSLVANHDTRAIGLIADGLRRGRDFPVPVAESVRLLDQAGAAAHVVTLRPYLDSADPVVQAHAARALSLDPQSRAKIVGLVTKPATPEGVRLEGLRGLSREDDGFASYSIPLIENSAESMPVRQAAMVGMAGRLNYRPVDSADQVKFARAVQKLSSDRVLAIDGSNKVQDEATRLHRELRNNFPSIRNFYENQ